MCVWEEIRYEQVVSFYPILELCLFSWPMDLSEWARLVTKPDRYRAVRV